MRITTEMELRLWTAWGAIAVALGIAIGAVGVHVLEGRGMVEGAERWALAGRYAVVMGLGQCALAGLRSSWRSSAGLWPERLLAIGLFLFAGGLVWMGCCPNAWVGQVIPYGGVCMMVAWIWAAGQILIHRDPRR